MVRLKTRYVLFEILHTQPGRRAPDGKQVLKAVRACIQEFFGELGLGRCLASLVLKYYNQSTATGILRVSREQAPIVQAALTYIRAIDGDAVVIRVMHVSGTIKRSEHRALQIRRASVFAPP